MLLSTTLSMLSLTLPSPHQLFGKKPLHLEWSAVSHWSVDWATWQLSYMKCHMKYLPRRQSLCNKMAELSAYRDQHFRVIIVFPFPFSFNCWASQWIKALIFVLLALGFTQWSRKDVSNEWYIVRGKSLILHNRGTNSRVIFAGWRLEKDCYGTGQGQEDSLWILLCWVSFAVEMKTF